MSKNELGYLELFEYVIVRGHSRTEISKRLDISPTTLYKYIKEESVPTVDILKTLSEEYNIPTQLIIKYFYDEDITILEEYMMDRKAILDEINIKRLIQKIKNKGITQREISERIGINERTISKYMKGESTPSSEIFRILCIEFEVKPELKRKYVSKESTIKEYPEIRSNQGRRLEELEELYKEYRYIKK